jgi:hypothetical protein
VALRRRKERRQAQIRFLLLAALLFALPGIVTIGLAALGLAILFLARRRGDREDAMKPRGSSMTGLLMFIVVLIGVLLTFLVAPLIWPDRALNISPELTMALAIVLTVAVMMALLFVVAAGFSALGLANKEYALGLPDGSIRALIALILIMVFIVLDIYMFRIVGQGTEGVAIFDSPDLIETLADTDQIINIQEVDRGDGRTSYVVAYRGQIDEDGTRLAQQVITTVGTLVVAVAGFYFGSASVGGGAAAAAAAAASAAGLSPVIVDFSPRTGKQNETISMKVQGRRLRGCRSIRLNRGTEVMSNSTDVVSSDSEASCSIVLSGTPGGERWDLVVENENGQRDVWEKVFELTP